jgi:hypothetical protein
LSVQLALVLQDVAARVSSTPTEDRVRQPARWAYALRDAVTIARPDWIVTHHGVELEAAAAAEQIGTVDDLLDLDLPATTLGRAALELTETLAGLYPSAVVAASVTGPATMAARLASVLSESDADLDTAAIDCGDVVAALAAAHAERGAGRVIVWEPHGGAVAEDQLIRAHQPVLRRLALLGVDTVAIGAEALDKTPYGALAWPDGGRRAALLRSDAFSDGSTLDAALAAATVIAGEHGVVLSDGPVPRECDLTALRKLGEHITEVETPGGVR